MRDGGEGYNVLKLTPSCDDGIIHTTHYTSSTCGISSDVHFFTVTPSPDTIAGIDKHCVCRQPVEIRNQVVSLGAMQRV